MPMYDYKCTKCGKILKDVRENSDASNEKDCVCKCSGIMKRLVGKPSRAQFKGSGFYETDY